jgi:hypothetical protein
MLGHGNEKCRLPGQPETRWGELSKKHGGLLFTKAEMKEPNHPAHETGETSWNLAEFKSVQILKIQPRKDMKNTSTGLTLIL